MLETARLRLRQWTDADREPLARLNGDPEVMRYFPARLTRAESDAMLERMRAHIDANGWGFWAAETREDREFIGIVGLIPVKEVMPFAPGVEVGWRLAKAHWGRGYATEGANAAIEHGFGSLGLREIVSLTAQLNEPSQAVMARLGMSRAGAFEHPALAADSPLRPHWLYRLSREPVAFACGNFDARQVLWRDVADLQRFYEANPGYFERVEGTAPGPARAREEIHGLPPMSWPLTRKLVIAFRARDGGIVGVAEMMQDLFSKGVWNVGFFMVADALHGSRVPHALYAHLEAWMRAQGARWLRLGVVRGNRRAERFWEKVGYVDVAQRRNYAQGALRHDLRVMAKPLAGGSLHEYRELVPRDREPALENS
jgi:RimJ/RimL family protein N-acetyltransferase